jgi:enoyl-[acyl-carrier protein] reductase I
MALALVTGVANDKSIAYGIAQALSESGREIVITYQNAKTLQYVEPLAIALGAEAIEMDVTKEGSIEAAMEKCGRISTLVHSIAWAPLSDLHGPVVECSADGFAQMMDVSVHSFIRLANAARRRMLGGTMIALTYEGSQRVVKNYGIMGVAKAALESAVRYLAVELAPLGTSVHAVSPGPIQTRAASGIKDFGKILTSAVTDSPLGTVTQREVGDLVAFLASSGARRMTGGVHYVDGGDNIMKGL